MYKRKMAEFLYGRITSITEEMRYASDADELSMYAKLLDGYATDLFELIKDIAF